MQPRTRRLVLALLAVSGFGGLMVLRSPKHVSADPTSTLRPYRQYLSRAEVTFNGALRRFSNTHDEFGLSAPDGAGRYAEIVGDHLDADSKPVFRSGGRLVATPWTDDAGRWLTPREYIDTLPGDATGALGGTGGGAATGTSSFAQLFRTTGGVNTATPLPVAMTREGTTFSWEGAIDPSPADGTGVTLELPTTFVHAAEAGWYVEVETDADVWAFIDDKLVIDGGAGSRLREVASSDARPLITVSDTIELNNQCTMSSGNGTPVLVQTNSTRARAVILGQGCRIEGDVLVGPGGSPSQVVYRGESTITGRVEPMSAGVTIPQVVIPAIGPVTGDLTVNQTMDVSTNLHVRDLTIFSGGRLRVRGDVTIVCDGSLRLSSDAHLDVLPGATLQLFSVSEIFISSNATVNNITRNPRNAMLATQTSGRVTVNSSSGVYADVLAPRGTLLVNNDSIFAGSFAGHAVQLNNGAGFHVGSTAEAAQSEGAVYRIDLDRLAWLSNGATHHLRLFVADRDGTPSRLRLRTNITALNLAALPHVGGFD